MHRFKDSKRAPFLLGLLATQMLACRTPDYADGQTESSGTGEDQGVGSDAASSSGTGQGMETTSSTTATSTNTTTGADDTVTGTWMTTGSTSGTGATDAGDSGSDGDTLTPCVSGSNNHLTPGGQCACNDGFIWCDQDSSNLNCCALVEPCSSGANNHVTSDGQCACNDGFEWCNEDTSDLNCCRPLEPCSSGSNNHQTADGCLCNVDHAWCDPDDATDLECCYVGVPSDTTCTANGLVLCTHSEKMGPEGSRMFECQDGGWTDITVVLTEACKEGGGDFAFGCVDNSETKSIEIVCGMGPGTPCTSETPSTCHSSIVAERCIDGRLAHKNCDPTMGGSCSVDGVQFEFGWCEIQDGEAGCICSDEPPR